MIMSHAQMPQGQLQNHTRMHYGIKPGQEALFARKHWSDGKTRLLVVPDERAMIFSSQVLRFSRRKLR